MNIYILLIINNLLFVLAFLFGWYFASKYPPESPLRKDLGGSVKRARMRLADTISKEEELKPGIIRRPSAQSIYAARESVSIRESKDAVRETLDNVPDLQAAKLHIESLRRQGVKV